MSKVVAVIATFRRPAELARLCRSLETSSCRLHGIVVVDNSNDEATQRAAASLTINIHYIASAENLGCGGGLAAGEKAAFLEFPNLTHAWILDDDAVVDPDTLETLLHALESENAHSACPQICDGDGKLGWFAGLSDRSKFRIICKVNTPAEFVEKCGPSPVAFSWSTGVALLVTRQMLEIAGFHRDDFWIRGEDLDFALRLTLRSRGVYVPTALVHHLPPPSPTGSQLSERMKDAAMLQNCFFLSLRTTHGTRIMKHLPGNMRRHLRLYGFRAILDLPIAFYFGALLGRPAGQPGADTFRKKLQASIPVT